jgi:hypothetical protein
VLFGRGVRVGSDMSVRVSVGKDRIVGKGESVGRGMIVDVVKEGDCEQPFNKRLTTVNIRNRKLCLFL